MEKKYTFKHLCFAMAIVAVFLTACIVALLSSVQAQSWRPLPGGSLDARVTAIYSQGGILWVGGDFTTAGPLSVSYVVRHDGYQWLPTPPLPSTPRSFCIYAGDIYALGSFTVGGIRYGAMHFNGTTWLPFAVLNSIGEAYAGIEYNGELYIGGAFTSVENVPAVSLAHWDGISWCGFSGITSCSWQTPPRVKDIHVVNNELYVCGSFDMIAGINANCVGVWNGAIWRPLDICWYFYASCFATVNSTTFVGGNFPYVGPYTSPGIARENNGTLQGVGGGVQMAVFAAEQYHNRLYVGGAGLINTGANIGNCGYWNGSNWITDNVGIHAGLIDALYREPLQDVLYAGGDFRQSWNDTADYIAYKAEITLPVDLLLFECELVGDILQATWVTASEINADHFVVSLSVDGSTYRDIQLVSAHGTSSIRHDYTTNLVPTDQTTNYVRLREYDTDGVLSGEWNCAVPVYTENTITFNSKTNSVVCTSCTEPLIVCTIDGRCIKYKSTSIDLSAYSPGLYVVRSVNKKPLRCIVAY